MPDNGTSADSLRQQIELKVVELLKDKLKDGLISEPRAQEISKQVLDILQPGMSLEQFYKVMPKLDDSFPELSVIVLPILRQYEQRIVGQAKTQVADLIRQGQFDAADKLAQRAINQEVNLVWTGKGSTQNTNC